jgi:hypothetical protein
MHCMYLLGCCAADAVPQCGAQLERNAAPHEGLEGGKAPGVNGDRFGTCKKAAAAEGRTRSGNITGQDRLLLHQRAAMAVYDDTEGQPQKRPKACASLCSCDLRLLKCAQLVLAYRVAADEDAWMCRFPNNQKAD